MALKIDQQNEVINLTEMAQVDGIDVQIMGKLSVRYNKGDFQIKFNMLSSMGDEPNVKDVVSRIFSKATEIGNDKLDAWRGTMGFGKQSDLFANNEPEPEAA